MAEIYRVEPTQSTIIPGRDWNAVVSKVRTEIIPEADMRFLGAMVGGASLNMGIHVDIVAFDDVTEPPMTAAEQHDFADAVALAQAFVSLATTVTEGARQ